MNKIIGLAAILAGLSLNAEAGVRGLKPAAAPPKYLVDGKTVTAAEAIVALLADKTVMKCTEVEAAEGRNGITVKAKRAN